MEKKITAFYGKIAKGQEEKIRKIEKGMELARKRIAEAFEKNKKEYPIDSMIKRLMEKKEFAVGEEFQFGLVKLKVKKPQNPRDPCRECFISKLTGNRDCFCFEPVLGECTCYDREDETSVIFVKVEE